jgi:hypothetical protein
MNPPGAVGLDPNYQSHTQDQHAEPAPRPEGGRWFGISVSSWPSVVRRPVWQTSKTALPKSLRCRRGFCRKCGTARCMMIGSFSRAER